MTPDMPGKPPQAASAPRRYRWLLAGILPLLLPLVLLQVVLGVLLASEVGLKSVLSYGLKNIPLLTVASVEGSLLTGFTLHNLRYVTEYEELDIAAITLSLSPRCLLRKTLCVETLAIRDFDWHILRGREGPDFDFPAVALPPLHLPLNVEIADASMNRLTIHMQESHFDISNARVRLHTDNDTLFINQIRTDLVFSALTLRAAVEGSLDLRGETAANLNARVGLDFSADVPDLNIEGDIRGSAYAPELSVSTHGLVEAHTELKASFREKGWPVYARVKQNAPIQLAESVPVTLSNTVTIISGYVNAYHVEGQTEVSGIPRTPTVTAGIITDGGFFGLGNGEADLHIGQQQADVRGEFTWYPRLYWNTSVDFAHLDAATWLQGATSDLTGSANVTGEWYPHIPFRNTVEHLAAKGLWRNHPVELATTFTTTASTLAIDQLDATLGSNRATLKGNTGERWDYTGNFNLPALNEVLPQLEGAIAGKFTVQGPRDKPAIQMNASSPHLKFADTQLDNVTAVLTGDPGQHTLTAAAQWQGYSAQAAISGQLEKQQWLGQLRTLDLQRDQVQFALAAPAPVSYAFDKKSLQVGNTCLQSVAQKACVKTAWAFTGGTGSLDTEFKAFEPAFLAPLFPMIDAEPGRWSGKARADFSKFTPTRAEWQLNVDTFKLQRLNDKRFSPAVTGRSAQLQGRLAQRQIEAEARILWPDNQRSHAVVSLPDINTPTTLGVVLDSAPLPVSWAAPWISAVKLQKGQLGGKIAGTITNGWPTLEGVLDLEDASLTNPGKSWGLEKLQSQLRLNGTTATLTGNTQDDRGMQWQLSTPLIATWSATERMIRLQDGCLSTGTSTLCSKGHYSLDEGIDLTADAHGNISPWLAPVLTDNALIDGPFTGTARLRQIGDQMTGQLQLRSTVSSTLPPEEGTTTPKVDIELNADLADHVLLTTLALRGDGDGGDGESRIEGTVRAEVTGNRTIDGHIDVHQVTIAPLKPLIREVEKLSGDLNGTFLVSGTLSQPTLEGELKLSDGQLSSAVYPFAFSKITANARFTQQNALLVADLESGKRGHATLTSNASWASGTLVTESRFKGEQIPVKQGSDINLRTDTDLTLHSSDGRIDLGGLIYVKEGFLRVAKLPENSTNVSRDVVYVDERGALESEKGIDAHLNLVVQLSDMVQLDGLGAQVRMSGAVGIQQTPPNDPIGRGSLTITEGTYTGYGQKLKITKGQILFNGPLDSPVLAIKAVREANTAEGGTVVAGINITGTPQQPESTLFSVPAMPEQDILSYIVLGRPRDTSGSSSNFAMNQALLSVGLYGSEDFTRDLASKVGIDDFEISTSTDADDRDSVNVGGYLSPKLFLQYGVGINTPVNTLTLRYRLTQRIFLEALSGAESALDVLYSFEVE